MDFCYIYSVTILLLPLCFGQDAPQDTATFEVKIIPGTQKQEVRKGDTTFLKCESTDSDVTLTWKKDGNPIAAGDDPRIVFDESEPGVSKMTMSGLIDDDNAKYTCEGTKGGQTAEFSVEIIVFMPITIKSKKEQHGLVGENAKIECVVEARPAPTIEWFTPDGTKVKPGKSDKYAIINAGTLQVSSLTLEDTGSYKCVISQISSVAYQETFMIEYTAVEVPSMVDFGARVDAINPKVGEDVKIDCEAKGTPEPTYQFMRADKLIEDDDRHSLNGNQMTIKSVTLEDEATYTCIATNLGGEAKSNVDLDLKIPPTIQDMAETYDVVEGQEKSIACTVLGDPAPTIAWSKVGDNAGNEMLTTEKGEATGEDKRVQTITETLVFKDITYADAGKYKCSAIASGVGSVEKIIELKVEYKPNFDTDYKETQFYGWRGQNVEMKCQANANPLATFEWFLPNAEDTSEDYAGATKISNEAPYTINESILDEENSLRSSSLMVQVNDDSSVYTDYLCKATNVHGTAWHKVTLLEAKSPGKPKLSIKQVLTSQITLKVELPTDNGGQKVTKYIYELQDMQKVPIYDAPRETEAKEGETLIDFGNLESQTEYLFKVKAENAVGPGDYVELIRETLEFSIPLKPSIKSTQMQDSPNSYHLKWESTGDGGSAISGFKIEYRKVKVKNEDKGKEHWEVASDVGKAIKKDMAGDKTEVRLDDLDKDSFYEVILKAQNKQGPSSDSRIIFKTSAGVNSAGTGSEVVIAVIVALVFLILLVALIVFLVIRRRKPELVDRMKGRLGGKEEEHGNADGKDPAEEEKLIKEDTVKVENEVNNVNGDQVIEAQPGEYEPDTKPETPAAPAENAAKTEVSGPEPATEIKITPDTPEKPENPAA